MIHEYEINNVTMRTGDVVCTTDWGAPIFAGEFWRIVGNLAVAEVDHVAVYVGPGGRCVEAGAKGKVVTYNVLHNLWDSLRMREERGEMIDTFYGVAYPLEGRGLSHSEESELREKIAFYCLKQADLQKPYNLDFFNSNTEHAFYSSQLVYMAYLKLGVNLNMSFAMENVPGTSKIIFPQEIWNCCSHRKSSWLNLYTDVTGNTC